MIEVRVQKKSKKGGKGADGGQLGDEKDSICYKPSISECHAMILSSVDGIVNSINQVGSLESDLVPFLMSFGLSGPS